MPCVLVIQHDSYDPAGLLADCFTGRGYELEQLLVVPEDRYRAPGLNVIFPGDPRKYDAIVSLGTDFSVGDRGVFTWLIPELMFLREAHKVHVPILGVCFGSQALALALGGLVQRAKRPEIGWQLLERNRGAPSPVQQGPWFQWHSDRWITPPGARLLLSTAIGGQAFVAGSSLGVQFHPEADTDLVRTWLAHEYGQAEASAAGIDAGQLLDDTRRYQDAARVRAGVLADRFLDRGRRTVRVPATFA